MNKKILCLSLALAAVMAVGAFSLTEVSAAEAPTTGLHTAIDYSRCGYRLSEAPIPDAPVRIYVAAGEGDQTDRIQRAIDYVAHLKADRKTGLRGAVLLGEGTFSISRQLRITASGVVLRGSDRRKTVILKTGYDRDAAISIEGTEPAARDTASLTASLPLGSATITTSKPLRAGDIVTISRSATKQWIARLGCATFGGGGDLGYWGWHPGEEDVVWTRRVLSADDHKAVLDAPLTMDINLSEGPCTVLSGYSDTEVGNCGVENLTVESAVDSRFPADEDHCWDGISISSASDCFVRRVVFRHLAGSAVIIQRSARQATVEDCASYEPVSEIGGWRRRTFLVLGERCLMQRLWSENGIHDYAVGDCAAGPTVFSGCETRNSLGFSGSIGPWATGILFDDVNIEGNDLKFTNLGLEKYGAGWNAANSVFYQCTASGIFCSDPDTLNPNRAYGCWGQFNGNSRIEECNNHVKPWSLFSYQLQARVGNTLAERISRPLVRRTGEMSNNPTPEEAAAMVAEAHKPRVTMEMWIDSVPFTASVRRSGVPEVDKLKLRAASTPSARADIEVKDGRLLFNGSLLTGRRHDTPWWNGRPRYNKIAAATYALTRFIPGLETNGATTRVDSVVALMRREGTTIFGEHYGLWYDRRRDDHERVQRRDGDVWAPFYEQPYRRTGRGKAWDGLSLYDLTKPNEWYYARLQQFCRKALPEGMMLLEQHYFQHNILEAGAHWVDCPWRRANNVNGTPTPEPVPFTGDKRIYVADRFYNLSDSLNRRLHHDYIFTQLDKFKDCPNVIHSIGEEYTGPYDFTRFWLETIGEWSRKNGRHPLVILTVNKNIQDSILADKELRSVVSAIGIEQWYYTRKGLYAPDGGENLAPRQYSRRLRPGAVGFEEVYRSVSETRKAYPDKAVCYFGPAYPQMAWAVLMAGGSCPALSLSDSLRKALATMTDSHTDGSVYVLSDGKGRTLVYAPTASSISLPAGKYAVTRIDEKTCSETPEGTLKSTGNIELQKGVYYLEAR